MLFHFGAKYEHSSLNDLWNKMKSLTFSLHDDIDVENKKKMENKLPVHLHNFYIRKRMKLK